MNYSLAQVINASNFVSQFNFFTQPDPTHSFVNYVDLPTAQAQGLFSNTTNIRFSVGTTVGPNGISSVRLESMLKYNKGLFIIDVAHIPFGCGIWPSFWMYGPDWPNNGEFDMIEGVHLNTHNIMTPHTSPGCQVQPANATITGTILHTDCTGNIGCGTKSNFATSYGMEFHATGGGVFATEWIAGINGGIKEWFFPRIQVPADITSGTPNPANWGAPEALYEFGNNCPDTHFKDMSMVLNIAICGDWAGNQEVWAQSTCGVAAPTCLDYVKNNALPEAFWDVSSIKVYNTM